MYRPKLLYLICCLFCLSLMALGCSESNKTSAEESTFNPAPGGSIPPGFKVPHPDGTNTPEIHGIWANESGVSMCLKCHVVDSSSKSNAPACRSCHTLFPHDNDWVKKENHGKFVLDKSDNDCKTKCHGSDLGGGLSKKSCTSCHSIYPHSQNWSNPKEHGETAKDDGKKICTPCHGDDFLGGLSKKSCASCHSLYPHSAGWEDPTKHGDVAKGEGKKLCQPCHGDDFLGGSSKISCYKCHDKYPHGNYWSQAAKHGAAAEAQPTACKTQCHGADLGGGLSGISCNSCHSIYPHSAGWEDLTKHGDIAKGDGKKLCQPCHGDDFLGSSSKISCYKCHDKYPHGNDWSQATKHGAIAAAQQAACKTQCHGVDLKGGASGRSCDGVGCHNKALYPHPDPSEWDVKHADVAKQLGITACQTCHGADYKTVLHEKNCFSCHPDYPHPDPAVWTPFAGGHGERVQTTYNKNTTECEKCHGTNLQTPKGADNRTCFTCHLSYPHNKKAEILSADWKNYEGHATHLLGSLPPVPTKEAVNGAIKECQMCHDKKDTTGAYFEIYTGGTRGQPSCFSSDAGCHTSFPHLANDWYQPQQTGQSTPEQGHGKYVNDPANGGTVSCATAHCHGTGLSFVQGTSRGNSCVSCHNLYPHSSTWETDHGVEAMTAGIAACKSCHSDASGDYQKRINGHRNCFDCHPDYPHIMPNWELNGAPSGAQAHANRVHVTYQDDTTKCELCHGADLQGGHSNTSCFHCHDYPHTKNPRWATLAPETTDAQGRDEGFHGDRFIRQRSIIGACSRCHGASYDRPVGNGNITCKDAGCHPNGITHAVPDDWRGGLGHGKYFSAGFTSESSNVSCFKCHGGPVNLVMNAQPPQPWANQADCYGCHPYYPHKASVGYSGGSTASSWGIVNQGHRDIAMYFNIEETRTNCGGNTNGACHTQPRSVTPQRYFDFEPCNYCHRPPPSVTSTNPPDGTTVPATTNITATFSTAMDSNSVINAFTFKNTGTNTAVQGTVICSAADSCLTATFHPTNSLEEGVVYQATIATTAMDSAGWHLPSNVNWSFTTSDTTPPKAISLTLAGGSTDLSQVPANTRKFLVRFNEQIRCNTVQTNTLTLRKKQTGGTIPVPQPPINSITECENSDANNNSDTIQFAIYSSLQLSYGATYNLTLKPGIQDLVGNTMSQSQRWTFVVEPHP